MSNGMNIHDKNGKSQLNSQQTSSVPQRQIEEDIAVFGNNSAFSTDKDGNLFFDKVNNPYQDTFTIDMERRRKKTSEQPSNTPSPKKIAKENEKLVLNIYARLSDYKYSKDNTEKLMQAIKSITKDNYKYVFLSYEIAKKPLTELIMTSKHLNNKERQECLDYLIDLGKETADDGNQRSDDVVPSLKDLIKKYDEANLSTNDRKRLNADFRKIVNRSDTIQTKIPDLPNGLIDEPFKQGKTGDCWLLAGIKGLSMTKEGKEILEKCISVDEQGNATVKLRGVSKTYKISARDLKCSNELSTGDTDIRALEIAMDRYFREEIPDGKADLNGNEVSRAFDFFAEPAKTKIANYQPDMILSIITDIQENGMTGKAAVTGMSKDVIATSIDATNEKGEKVTISNSHAYTLVNADKDYVYLINPHDSTVTIKVPVTQYLDKFNALSITDVNGIKY